MIGVRLPRYDWIGGGVGDRPEDYPGVLRFVSELDAVRGTAERLGLPVTRHAAGMDITLNSQADALAFGRALGDTLADRWQAN